MTGFHLKTMTLNCRGLRDKGKRLSVFELIKRHNIDITFIQETFVTETFVDRFNRDLNYDVYHCVTDSSHSRGVAIVIKREGNIHVININRSNDGRRLLINIKYNDESFCLVAAYAPDQNRVEFLKRLSTWIRQHAIDQDRIIIGADMNTVDMKIDRASGNLDKSSTQYTKFKEALDISDTWRHHHPSEISYTYIHPSGNGKSRIDYILASDNLMPFCQNTEITVAPVPDHKAVISLFSQEDRPRGRGYWK